jgi:hypothetical protein
VVARRPRRERRPGKFFFADFAAFARPGKSGFHPGASAAKTLLDSGGGINYSPPMFDIVRPQIATAADKVAHLRRFL